jgi:toxin FitB
MFLIDTVTLSELRRRQRDPGVVAWSERQRTTDLFLSVISIGEIERGRDSAQPVQPLLTHW